MSSSLLRVSRNIPRISPSFLKQSTRLFPRSYATELPRPPPPTHEPIVETFSASARPRPYYARPPLRRELPPLKKRWPLILSLSVVGVGVWGVFLAYMTNQEKISSSVFRQVLRAVRQSPELKDLLGEAIRPQAEWWLNGDPQIHGNISQLQGNVDISFRVKGSKGSATLYFTSIRKEKGLPFTILRFKVIGDDGTVVHVNATPA